MSLLRSGHLSSRYILLLLIFDPLLINPAQIQASGQRKEWFEKQQRDHGFDKPLKIPLHGNTRWGTAFAMCERAYKLHEVHGLVYHCISGLIGIFVAY